MDDAKFAKYRQYFTDLKKMSHKDYLDVIKTASNQEIKDFYTHIDNFFEEERKEERSKPKNRKKYTCIQCINRRKNVPGLPEGEYWCSLKAKSYKVPQPICNISFASEKFSK